jgi:hypothetical protein
MPGLCEAHTTIVAGADLAVIATPLHLASRM